MKSFYWIIEKEWPKSKLSILICHETELFYSGNKIFLVSENFK